MAIPNYRVEPLNKENYDTWVQQAQAVLIKADAWKYVSGEEPCPDDQPTNAEAKRTWIKSDLSARSDIVLMVSTSELRHIKTGCPTSKNVWDKYKEIYASSGPAKKAYLLKRLILKKMNDGENMIDHVNEFFDVIDKLAEMDIPIHDDLQAIMLLYSLSPSYENFRVAIESRDNLPSPNQLKIKILEEHEARSKNNSGSSTHPEEAFYAKNK